VRSIEKYQRALSVYQRLGYLEHQAEAVNWLGITNRYARHREQAINAFEQYQTLTQNNRSQHGRFTAQYGFGTACAEKGDCDLALPTIATALSAEGSLDY
jgi:tetratricopeptide (TPR) repeat protein